MPWWFGFAAFLIQQSTVSVGSCDGWTPVDGHWEEVFVNSINSTIKNPQGKWYLYVGMSWNRSTVLDMLSPSVPRSEEFLFSILGTMSSPIAHFKTSDNCCPPYKNSNIDIHWQGSTSFPPIIHAVFLLFSWWMLPTTQSLKARGWWGWGVTATIGPQEKVH